MATGTGPAPGGCGTNGEKRGVAAMEERLFFEDFVPGRRFTSPEHEVTAESIVSFAREYDPQPFHTDPETAADSFFGAHVASGWQTSAVAMRLMVATLPIANGVIGAGAENLRWPMAVRPGDRLHLEIAVESARASASRPDIGIVGLAVKAINQNGEMAMELHPRLVVPLRGHA